uniref:Uncharacterized protein n=1 Tax=viral metagenome TaxID=1070528 RepID=A0A6C0IWN5_9ZZZZ
MTKSTSDAITDLCIAILVFIGMILTLTICVIVQMARCIGLQSTLRICNFILGPPMAESTIHSS